MNKFLQILKDLGGYYSCPKDPSGKRLGKLVGYAGKYDAPDGTKKQFVGDVYVNFAKADEHPTVLFDFAKFLMSELPTNRISFFCGAPIGGYSLADILGLVSGRQVLKAEKKTTALATASSREQTALFFGRHIPKQGTSCIIVEDVCNNFSTTDKLVSLLRDYGCEIAGIACFLNRSPIVDAEFTSAYAGKIPIFSLVRQIIPEFKQDDPEVKDDVDAGNVIWKPKDEWAKLEAAMGSAT